MQREAAEGGGAIAGQLAEPCRAKVIAQIAESAAGNSSLLAAMLMKDIWVAEVEPSASVSTPRFGKGAD
jgi:hypothetical protein